MKGLAGTPLRILIVDDNVDTTTSLTYLFGIWGHEVRVVHDGPSSLEAALAFQPDAVILDIGLPGMDGFEVAQHLRCLPGLELTLLIACSGFNGEKYRRLAMEAGINLYLVKPFDPWQLEPILASARSRGEVIPVA